MFQKFSQWLDRGVSQEPPENKNCDHAGCVARAQFRAPKSRLHLEHQVDEWYWFCLDHIRAYNDRWNYFNGMSEEDQLQERIKDMVGHRPSWPMGSGPARPHANPHIKDPFGFFDHHVHSGDRDLKPRISTEEDKALMVFELTFPFTKAQLQRRYRDLAKQHHPDANNNSPESQQNFRTIKEGYELLKKRVG